MAGDKNIDKWMEDVGSGKRPRTKLVFDPRTKKLRAVSTSTATSDEALEFTPEEAKRFRSSSQ